MAAKLGLGSVEELEVAIDSMEGIADDGGELEKDNLAREARIRSAYIEWCKEYGKPQDESRFPQFATNFLAMEEFAKEAGKDMVLNEYADCTEEEYARLTAKKTEPLPKETVTKEGKVTETKEGKEAAAVAAKEAAAQAAREAAAKAAKLAELAKKRLEEAFTVNPEEVEAARIEAQKRMKEAEEKGV